MPRRSLYFTNKTRQPVRPKKHKSRTGFFFWWLLQNLQSAQAAQSTKTTTFGSVLVAPGEVLRESRSLQRNGHSSLARPLGWMDWGLRVHALVFFSFFFGGVCFNTIESGYCSCGGFFVNQMFEEIQSVAMLEFMTGFLPISSALFGCYINQTMPNIPCVSGSALP